MPSMIMELNVELEDGSTYQVVADQRDIAKWEIQPFGFPAAQMEDRMSMSMLRFLAWSAMTRQQLTALKWDAFNDQCVEAVPLDDEEGSVPADASDPGQPARSAGRQSRSRTTAGNRSAKS